MRRGFETSRIIYEGFIKYFALAQVQRKSRFIVYGVFWKFNDIFSSLFYGKRWSHACLLNSTEFWQTLMLSRSETILIANVTWYGIAFRISTISYTPGTIFTHHFPCRMHQEKVLSLAVTLIHQRRPRRSEKAEETTKCCRLTARDGYIRASERGA